VARGRRGEEIRGEPVQLVEVDGVPVEPLRRRKFKYGKGGQLQRAVKQFTAPQRTRPTRHRMPPVGTAHGDGRHAQRKARRPAPKRRRGRLERMR
jgi:hypothetical protein